MDDLIILITADHGENMGELGNYGEHGTADHATCRIPMIMRWPGMQAGHVAKDSHERRNVAGDHLAERKTAVYHLNDWHDERMKSMPFDVDPLWTVIREGGPYHAKGHLPAYVQRLEATDRGAAEEELRKRHPGEFR